MNTALLNQTFPGLDVDFLGPKQSGKVRDIYARDDQLILITTDRLSAFDHILGLVPFKGQVLNQLSSFWFEQTRDIVANHFLESPDPNVTIARKCRPLPVEVVVRGFISGVTKTSLWYQYSQGERTIYGMDFPDGMSKNERLPQPVITPTTKADKGGHDELITSKEIVENGLVAGDLWEQICTAALALFARGQEVAARGGLLLVDTKYEFGLTDDNQLLLIDEIHTPDSSRFWTMKSYEEVRASQRAQWRPRARSGRTRELRQGVRSTGLRGPRLHWRWPPSPLGDGLGRASKPALRGMLRTPDFTALRASRVSSGRKSHHESQRTLRAELGQVERR